MLVVEHALPLRDHAEHAIVHDDDLHGNAVRRRRRHLLTVHHDAAVAREEDDLLSRSRDLRADGGGQTVAHRAETARRQEAARLLRIVVLCRPHLMLSDVGHDDRIVIGKLADRLNELLRHDAAFLLLVGKRLLIVHLDRVATPPGKACAQIAERGQLLLEERQRPAQVAEHAAVSDDILVHLDGIDLEVHDLCARCKSCNTARHAVIETHADGDEQIALLNCHVRRICAVHARHAEEVFACGRHAADAHERRHRRNSREI